VIEHLPGMYEDLDLIPSTIKKKKKEEEEKKERERERKKERKLILTDDLKLISSLSEVCLRSSNP
jgi:hypothetical protein